jgi:phosphoribosylanthranilate isomerase
MTVVKICGLRTLEHALAALEAGADLLGFIFAPARRQVSPAEVAAIGAALRATGRGADVRMVGVFVNETPARMTAIADQCGLAMLQLSGDEDTGVLRELPPDRPVVKALRLAGAPAEQGWLRATEARLLVDAHVPGAYGGAGIMADWERAAELNRQRPIMLAGGLSPANVGAAIEQVSPWGVDVSSGVETHGHKDSEKIRAFVAAARAADRRLELRDRDTSCSSPIPHLSTESCEGFGGH